MIGNNFQRLVRLVPVYTADALGVKCRTAASIAELLKGRVAEELTAGVGETCDKMQRTTGKRQVHGSRRRIADAMVPQMRPQLAFISMIEPGYIAISCK